MPNEIGFAVQPRTYLTSRQPGESRLLAPLRGAAELTKRATLAQRGGSKQGFIGTLSSAYAGHTLLHARSTPAAGPVQRFSTGFSPDGVVNSARIGIGPGPQGGFMGAVAGGLGGLALGAMAGYGTTGATLGATSGALALRGFGARNAPGAFHDETGIQHDPKSLGATRQVGPGMHAAFTGMQRDLVENHRGTYSFQPDLRRTQNCGTSAISQMRGFVDRAKAHTALMGELQSVGLRAGAGAGAAATLAAIAPNNKNRVYSANQQMERTSLRGLDKLTTGMEKTVQRASENRRGNQGYLTKFVTHRNATHGAV